MVHPVEPVEGLHTGVSLTITASVFRTRGPGTAGEQRMVLAHLDRNTLFRLLPCTQLHEVRFPVFVVRFESGDQVAGCLRCSKHNVPKIHVRRQHTKHPYCRSLRHWQRRLQGWIELRWYPQTA